MLNMDDIVANLQITEIRKERRSPGTPPRAVCDNGIRFVEEIARAEESEVGFGKQHAVRDIALHERGGLRVSEAGRLLDSILRARADAAAHAVRQVVFGEDAR